MTTQELARAIVGILACTLLGGAALAQEAGAAGKPGTQEAAGKPGKQEQVAALKQSLAQNQAALKQYTWTETTQVSLKGEVKKTEQKQCHYGPDGKVQKTPAPGAAPQAQEQEGGGGRRKGGAAKKAVVQKKVGETKEYMERVAGLVHEYVPPNPQKIQAAQAAGNVSVQPQQGTATITVKDYAKPGDSLAIGFDANTKKMRSFNVHSYLDKPDEDKVTLAVTFASLPDGTSYPQQTVLDAPGKNIQVKVTNSGYSKAGP